MDPSNFAVGLSRETTIRRNAEGTWFHDGEKLAHDRLSHAFECWIERAEDGRFCLKNDVNWAYFTLEGPPFFVRGARVIDGVAQLTLSNDREVTLDPHTLREGPEGALYCEVAPDMCARFDKHAAMQLEGLIDEDELGPYVLAGHARVRPPRVSDPLKPLRPPTEGARR